MRKHMLFLLPLALPFSACGDETPPVGLIDVTRLRAGEGDAETPPMGPPRSSSDLLTEADIVGNYAVPRDFMQSEIRNMSLSISAQFHANKEFTVTVQGRNRTAVNRGKWELKPASNELVVTTTLERGVATNRKEIATYKDGTLHWVANGEGYHDLILVKQ